MEHVVCVSASPVVPDHLPRGSPTPLYPRALNTRHSWRLVDMYRRIYARQAHPGQVFCLRIRGNRHELAPSPTRQKLGPILCPRPWHRRAFIFTPNIPPAPRPSHGIDICKRHHAGKVSAAVAVQHAMRLCSHKMAQCVAQRRSQKKTRLTPSWACATTTPTPHEMSTV